MERLTDDLEEAATALFDQVEEMGGAVAAIEAGWMQAQIEDAAYREARAQETGESVVVGVNKYVTDETEKVPVMRIDPELERSQVARLQEWRASRDGVDAELAVVEAAARGEDNLLPVMREALRAGATIGEVSDTLRRVFGTHR
ncbi:MAG: methylmalonyl-CoA mutase family protein, partial [Acidimicrobiia bacterium]